MTEDKLKYWAGHKAAWKKSGLSQERYCEKNRLIKSTFSYWLGRLSKENLKNKLVQIPISFTQHAALEIVLKNGIKIFVHAGFDPVVLKAAIHTLEVL